MKKVFAIFTMVFAFTILSAAQAGSASGSAQAGAGDQETQKKASPKKGAAGSATLTGCLSGPNDEGVYELKSGKKEVEVGGLDDLSKHIGHKVRLHGAWAKNGAEIGEKKTRRAKPKKVRERRARSATSKSRPSITSVTLVRPGRLKKVSTTKRAQAQALRPKQ